MTEGDLHLSDAQREAWSAFFAGESALLTGSAGTGKTSITQKIILDFLQKPEHDQNLLVLVPQRSSAKSYASWLQKQTIPSGTVPSFLTIHGLAQRTIALFWPLLTHLGLFKAPAQQPIFLTLETAQFFLGKIVDEAMDNQGYFHTLHIKRPRLYSQILDNLNKSALIGYPLEETALRLSTAWNGESGHTIIFEQAQDIALRFRHLCYEKNLLDFSLQLEVFAKYLNPHPQVREYLSRQFKYLIYDNIEEDGPVPHEIVRSWFPFLSQWLLVRDENASYRTFMGADEADTLSFHSEVDSVIPFSHSFQSTSQIQKLRQVFFQAIDRQGFEVDEEIKHSLRLKHERLQTGMIDSLTNDLVEAVDSGIAPENMIVISPMVTDTLRFSLSNALQKKGLALHAFRPSRPMNVDPAFLSLLTLACLAHPHWRIPINKHLIQQALIMSIEGLDYPRAAELATLVFKHEDSLPVLKSLSDVCSPQKQQQITFLISERFERLRHWLTNYQASESQPLDVFLSQLFGEVLSQKGFGFHSSFEHAALTKNMIESVQKFRKVQQDVEDVSVDRIGADYVTMIRKGIAAAQYLDSSLFLPGHITLAPAHTYLMTNQPVVNQYWLDIGNFFWSQRIDQPLTHPFVLSRRWELGRKWTHQDEMMLSEETLKKIIHGLTVRCNGQIHLYATGINEQGQEQNSPFLRALQRISQSLYMLEQQNV